MRGRSTKDLWRESFNEVTAIAGFESSHTTGLQHFLPSSFLLRRSIFKHPKTETSFLIRTKERLTLSIKKNDCFLSRTNFKLGEAMVK